MTGGVFMSRESPKNEQYTDLVEAVVSFLRLFFLSVDFR
jgi:hypothetical protein